MASQWSTQREPSDDTYMFNTRCIHYIHILLYIIAAKVAMGQTTTCASGACCAKGQDARCKGQSPSTVQVGAGCSNNMQIYIHIALIYWLNLNWRSSIRQTAQLYYLFYNDCMFLMCITACNSCYVHSSVVINALFPFPFPQRQSPYLYKTPGWSNSHQWSNGYRCY